MPKSGAAVIHMEKILNEVELIKEVDILKIQQYLVIDGISKNKELKVNNNKIYIMLKL